MNGLMEIEAVTARAWLQSGAVTVTDIGQENVYFVDQFDHESYCKDESLLRELASVARYFPNIRVT